MTVSTPPKVYKIPEVAEILFCDISTVYRLIRDDRLRVVKLGRAFRVTETALAEFMGEV